MTDIYEFTKSTLPQGVSEETPYAQKHWNYIQDINAGSYTSGSGLSLVQFDLSSIYNSSKLVDVSQTYLAIPITYCTAWTKTDGTTVAPTKNAWASTGLKSGYFQLLQGLDLTIAGKVVEQFVPNLNQYVSFKMLSQMSQDDLKAYGATLGMGDTIDNWESLGWISSANNNISTATALNAVTPVAFANGMSNNQPFPINPPILTGVTWTVSTSGITTATATITVSSNASIVAGMYVTGEYIPANTFVVSVGSSNAITLSQQVIVPAPAASTAIPLYFYDNLSSNFGDDSNAYTQWSGSYNNGFYSRLKRIPDTTNTASGILSNLYGTDNTKSIATPTTMRTEFRPYFTTNTSSNIAYWYDIAIIRTQDILDSMKQLPLMKKFDAQMRLYLNVGSVVSNIVSSGSNGFQVTSATSNTFTNTCPLIQSALQVTPAATVCVTSALFIGSPQATSIAVQGGTVNFNGAGANAAAAHFMPSCRFYFPQVDLKPEKLDMYISSNRAKKICFTSVLNNTFSNISSGTTSSFLVQSGVSNIRGIFILPSVASTVNGAVSGTSTYTTPFSQALSPFDTYPMTSAPISLINLQVAVGGVNQLANVYSYSFENFLHQVSTYEKINGADLGLSCGLINQAYWEANRMYYVDLSRCNPADLLTPRNITISFTNNSNVTIDVQVFTEYYREMTLDVETGLITI